MLPQKMFKFRGSEMLFPASSTGHFNKYERKCKWLEYILLISNVVNSDAIEEITSQGRDQ